MDKPIYNVIFKVQFDFALGVWFSIYCRLLLPNCKENQRIVQVLSEHWTLRRFEFVLMVRSHLDSNHCASGWGRITI